MSASDKKRQRKAGLVDGMTQRERRDRREAQAAKRKKTIYAVVGGVCAVAAIALLVWNNLSSSINTNAVAATVGGVDYKVPDLQYYYMTAKNQEIYMAQLYASYGISFDYDYTVDEGEQWYSEADGTTYADRFRESALESLRQTAALVSAAKEAGYTLSAEGQATVEGQLEQINQVCAKNGLTRNSYFSQVYGHGVTEKVFLRNLQNDVLASEFKTYHQENISYDDDALTEYYENNKGELDSFDYRIFPISGAAETTADADGNEAEATDEAKEAAMAEAKEKADKAVAEIKAAGDKEAAFAAAAYKYVDETSRAAYADSAYSLAKGVLGNTLTSSGAAVADWLLDGARKTGDVAAIEATERYYVVMYLDRYLSNENTVDVRHILVMASTDDSTETDEKGYAIPTEEAMNDARTKAQEILDKYLAGDKTEDTFAALAGEYSEDTGSNTKGGLYTYVTRGQMVPNFNDWIFDEIRQPGDTGLVENIGSYSGVHVMYFVGTQEPAWKGTAISNKQSADQSTWLEEVYAAVTAEARDGMRYVGNASTAVATPVESAAAAGETDVESAESAAG